MDNLNSLIKKIAKISKKSIILGLSAILLINVLLFPSATFAEENKELAFNINYKTLFSFNGSQILDNLIKKEVKVEENAKDVYLPESKELTIKYKKTVVITAYNSEVGQCDDSPCITANGFDVCKHGKEDTIAINGLKFGTKIRIPSLFENRVFIVRDRMNSRYGSDRMDIWMKEKPDAVKFGVKRAEIEVLES